jgi:hypothetical protein
MINANTSKNAGTKVVRHGDGTATAYYNGRYISTFNSVGAAQAGIDVEMRREALRKEMQQILSNERITEFGGTITYEL